MIFVTVGTQLAFDRLISAVDNWNEVGKQQIFIQTGPSTYSPKYAEHAQFVEPNKADQLFRESELIISHAGMGSILTALRYQKPIIIMPRKASLGEHRNDHQLATCKWLGSRPGIIVAKDENQLIELLNDSKTKGLGIGNAISPYASDELINNIKNFFNN